MLFCLKLKRESVERKLKASPKIGAGVDFANITSCPIDATC